MQPEQPAFVQRFHPVAGTIFWLAWFVAAVSLSVSPFLWHVEYFRNPGPVFYQALLVVLPVLVGAVFLYVRWRRRGWWLHEPLFFSGLLLAGCLLYQPGPTVVVLWLFVSCYATGRFFRTRWSIECSSPSEEIPVSSGLGFGILICALFLLGLLGLYYRWVFAVLLGVPCVVFARELRRLPPSLLHMVRTWRAAEELKEPLPGIASVFAAVFLLFTILVGLAPSINIDGMLFHLPEIRYYAARHALEPFAALPYSYYPKAVETLMTLSYSLAGQTAAEMVHPLFFLLTLLLAYATARRCSIETAPAILGVVLGGTIPFLHWTGSILKNDFALAFFQLASLYCCLRGRQTARPNWMRLGVFFLAMSLGVKHVAVFGAIPLGLMYLQASWRRPRLLLSLAAIGLVFGLFWHVRTYQLTGNPFYPTQPGHSAKQWAPLEGGDRPFLPLLYLQYPWILHFEGTASFESPSENPLGIFLVLFWPGWLLVRRRMPAKNERLCWFFVAVYFLYWGYIWGLLRYALVPALLIFIFAAARLLAFYKVSRWPVRATAQAGLVYSFVFVMLVTMLIEVNAPQLRLFAGQIGGREYLRQAVRYYPAVEYLQNHAGPNDWVLSLDNVARGYAPHPERFVFVSLNPRDRALKLLEEKLAERSYLYIILPTEIPQQFLRAIQSTQPANLVYEDASFSVYRVNNP